MGLFQHSAQSCRISLSRGDLFKVQGVHLVFLDGVKRTQNQAFHLQLVDLVQLSLNT